MKSASYQKNDEHYWIEEIQQGDHRAFEKMFKEYYLPLTRFAWRFVKSKAIAEEIIQDVFADLWDNRENWQIDYSLRAYLYKMVRNESLNHVKRKKIEEKYDGKWMSQRDNPKINFDYDLREKQIREAIKQAVENLPRRAKMTYKLHRHDGLTYNEIAKVMGVSVKTVESQMTRALQMLREQLSYLLLFVLACFIV